MTEIINFPTQSTTELPTVNIPAQEVKAPKTVNFRGQEVTLKYTLLSLQRLEAAGVSLQDLETMGDNVSITVLGKVLWAGLCVQFNDATLEEVLNSYEISDLQEVSEALAAALNNPVGKQAMKPALLKV